jgi:uncharacterized small protein (DUF1192 family)
MKNDELSYDDLTTEELSDEIAGLDQEIEDCQASIARARRSLKQKQDLRDTLIELCSRKRQVRGWQRK